ncbi:MAG: aminopeptidase N [Bacteriovoracaceae bacterium]
MKDLEPSVIRLEDYKPHAYSISKVYLEFNLGKESTIVRSKLEVFLNDPSRKGEDCFLDGENLTLLGLKIDGKEIDESYFEQTSQGLKILTPAEKFTLEIENEISPVKNTTCEGLYISGNILCTQNEPEGFRHITYFIDRPDVMAIYTTKLVADKKEFPTLLANGNFVEKGESEDNQHYAIWFDPFPKPSYLYALVAGDLERVTDVFTTASGRKVDLEIFCDPGNGSKCGFAMESLKNAMKWDEERFGLEYDLDIYMIVAVDSFNMGAMENKGLNIFNSRLVLANPDTATDHDFMAIEAVIGHEYFHNWTGNRVTCRDWFQLTLKEGLTVFRDQEFSADQHVRAVKRIEDVKTLRDHQFSEDAGPMSHPIKPSSYIEINNFYTLTIYEKGAEVIRMFQTLLGKEGFRKGVDKYFELHDGKAVTTEDFIEAMSLANNHYDFSEFKKWYHQSGTPWLSVKTSYDQSQKQFKVEMEQETKPTHDQKEKKPLLLPLKFGLVLPDGTDNTVECKNTDVTEDTIMMRSEKMDLTFENVQTEPVLSLNREFSSPIMVKSFHKPSELAFLMSNDKDGFNRYESGQKLYTWQIENIINDSNAKIENSVKEAFGRVLDDKNLDYSTKAFTLTLPSESSLYQNQSTLLIDETHHGRTKLQEELAKTYQDQMLKLYQELQSEESSEYSLGPKEVGGRALRSVLLSYLMAADSTTFSELAYTQFSEAKNMTNKFNALKLLSYYDNLFAEKALSEFYNDWQSDTLVMQKWLAVQVAGPSDLSYDRLLNLEENPVYDVKIPNLVRALFGPFVVHNYVQFHHDSGRGYQLLSDRLVTIDKINPQVSARLANAYKDLAKLPQKRRDLMDVEIKRLLETPNLSKNAFEILSKIRDSE